MHIILTKSAGMSMSMRHERQCETVSEYVCG